MKEEKEPQQAEESPETPESPESPESAEISAEDLKAAFEKPKKKRSPLVVLITGIVVLAAGASVFIVKKVLKPAKRDAEFLVEMGEWRREDTEGVIWTFTEIGKGTLTTNNHQNDYDFLWSIDGDTLKIETKWLYNLNDEYTYKLQQDNKTLVLSSKTGSSSTATGSADDSSENLADINFRATGRIDTEVPENN